LSIAAVIINPHNRAMSDTAENDDTCMCECGSGLPSLACCGAAGRTAVNADVYARVSLQGITSGQSITKEITRSIASVAATPELFAARIHLTNDKAWFVKMSRKTYRESVFLDPLRIKGTCVIEADIPWLAQTCEQISWQPTPFIFHSAFCGSTLMSQVLETIFNCISLREPELLGNLIHYLAANVSEEDKKNWFTNFLKLMSRRYQADSPVIVKANDYANPLMPEFIRRQTQDTPVLFMYTPLNEFTAACLKVQSRRDWIKQRYFSVKPALPEVFRHYVEDSVDESNDGEMAAVYWSYNMAMYLQAYTSGKESVRNLNFNDMLADPLKVIKLCGKYFKLTVVEDINIEEKIEASFGVYSKNSTVKYSPGQRSQELNKQLDLYQQELNAAEKVARQLLGSDYPNNQLPGDLIQAS